MNSQKAKNKKLQEDKGKNMKNYIWVIVVIVILVIIGFFAFSNRTNDTGVSPGDAEDETTTDLSPNGTEEELEGTGVDAGDSGEEPGPVEIPEPVSDTTDLPGPQTIVVTYTGTGFVSRTVNIKVGDTVQFVNKGEQQEMWVASNVHPLHDILPTFDQKSSVGFNGVYEFTFDDAGTWEYHNHLRAGDTGKVVVR